jgi:N-acetylglutamate synthase-like GNAT family acetyltransferase
MRGAVRRCAPEELDDICAIINDAAQAYRGTIPEDRWRDPYMPRSELETEVEAGVDFSGYEEAGRLLGVMGVQAVGDVTLIRHAYVRTAVRSRGIGSRLLQSLLETVNPPVLVGTWVAADWAVRFYEKHGFRKLGEVETARVLRTYWSIPNRQIETSVVLADPVWHSRGKQATG